MPGDYVKEIRKIIGKRPLLSVGLGALIVREDGRILFEKRSDNGLYCLPGGSIDLGEKLEEAARREVLEEVGLELNDLTLFLITSGEEGKICYPNGDVTYYVSFYFLTSPRKGQKERIADRESSELRWFSPSEVPEEKYLLPGTKKALDAYLRFQGCLTLD